MESGARRPFESAMTKFPLLSILTAWPGAGAQPLNISMAACRPAASDMAEESPAVDAMSADGSPAPGQQGPELIYDGLSNLRGCSPACCCVTRP